MAEYTTTNYRNEIIHEVFNHLQGAPSGVVQNLVEHLIGTFEKDRVLVDALTKWADNRVRERGQDASSTV